MINIGLTLQHIGYTTTTLLLWENIDAKRDCYSCFSVSWQEFCIDEMLWPAECALVAILFHYVYVYLMVNMYEPIFGVF